MLTSFFLAINTILFLVILHYLRQLIEITDSINIKVLPAILPALYNKDYSSSSTDSDTDNSIPTGSYTVTLPTTNWNNNFSVPQNENKDNSVQ